MKCQVTVRQRKCEVITGPAGSVTGVARNVQFITAMVNKKLMTKKKTHKHHFVCIMCLLLYRLQTTVQSNFTDLQTTVKRY